MPEEIRTPENTNNDTDDFLYQQKLFIGLGENQFEVRKRFEKNESEIGNVKGTQESAAQEKQAITQRVEALETAKETQDNTNRTTAETLENNAKSIEDNAKGIDDNAKSIDDHINDNNVHVSEDLKNHPNDVEKHLPIGGAPKMVLAKSDLNTPFWSVLSELLPPELSDIIENGGNVTPEQVINAFREITVSQWTHGGLPLGATTIKTAVFAYDRFFVGGSDGRVSHSFDSQSWKAAQMLFGDPSPAAVEAIAYAKTENDETIVMALDAYSDFRISIDRMSWCPRLSIRVNVITTQDGNIYADRYETADFTCVVADRGLFIIATTSGTVYRATYQQVLEEYERALEAEYDRHSTVWRMNESQNSITQGTLCGASGGGQFILAGRYGNLAISATAVIWETITTSPFGVSNINSIAAGDDRFIAVSDSGKIAYALFSNPKQWYLIPDHPLNSPNENLRSVKYGGGVWIIVSNSGKVITSKQGMVWKEVSANLQAGGTAIAFGDTYFVIGDESGNIRRSLSVAGIFSVVTTSEFAALMERILSMTNEEILAMLQEWERIKAEIAEALSYQLTISNAIPKKSSLHGSAGTTEIKIPVLDENGDPVLDENNEPLFETKPQNKTLAPDHDHPNLDLVLLSQLDRATQESNPTDPFHVFGIPILDTNKKLKAENQTWQRGAPDGLAPLGPDGKISPIYLVAGWMYDTMIAAIRDTMFLSWTIQSNTIFQDLGDYSRINAFAKNATTIVAVGEKGRIAWGPNIKLLQMAVSPFGQDDSVVGVANGTRPDGTNIFVAVSQTHYSTSLNGWDWTDAVELSTGIQGVFYGGGFFLIPDSAGNIWRSSWNGNVLSFLQQESSQLDTQGTKSIAYLQDEWVGVGAGNKIVKSTDPAYWTEEQSPLPADTQLNCVFTGNGIFVAVGSHGRAVKRAPGVAIWTTINTGVTNDLHVGLYEELAYIVGGKNGTIITSTDASAWIKRDSKTTSTIRATLYKSERYLVGSDAGQIIASRSISDVLHVSDGTGVGPSNDDPNPLGDVPYSGDNNNYMRADATIPNTGLVLEKNVGKPTTYKTVDDQEVVDRYGVPPLNREGQIPDQFIRWLIGLPTIYQTETDPDTGEITKTPVRWGLPYLLENGKIPEIFMAWLRGAPNGIAELDENGLLPDSRIKKGQPNGVTPLDNDNLVPKEHLPPTEINIEQVINVIKGGNGLEFLEQISPFQQGVGVSTIIHDGCYGNGVHVLVGEVGIAYSENNGNWILPETQPFGNVPAIGAVFGKDDQERDVFVAINTEKRYSVSYTGKDWSSYYTIGGNNDFESIAYYNRTFVILCSNGVIWRSVDVENWEQQADSPNITAYCNDIDGGNNIFVVVGNGGKICISDDASHFTIADSPTTEDLLTVTFAKGTFLIGGNDNVLITGKDGTDFARIVSPFTGNAPITGTGYDAENGIFIVTNANGQIATSSNLIDWTNHSPQPTIVRIKAITAGNKRIVIGDDSGNIFASKTSLEINYPGISDEYPKKAYVDAKFQEAIDIATGARLGIVFASTQQLQNWIAGTFTRPDGITPDDLKVGESIYIVATNEPDYWWDGNTYQEQETKTVIDLSSYATKVYVQDQIDAIDLGEANNVWIGSDFEKNSDGTYSGRFLNENGVPAGERIDHLIPLQSPDEEDGESGGGNGNKVVASGYRQIFVDKENGDDTQTGLDAENAIQTWDKCVELLNNVTTAEITLSGFDETDELFLLNDRGISIIIVNNITVNTIYFVGLLSVQFRGEVSANSIFFTNINSVRFFETVMIDSVEECPTLFCNESSNVYFEKLVTATATDGYYPTTFVKVQDLSVTKFRELVIEDTGLNDNTKYLNIEIGSEVYIAGIAKHRNPYATPEPDTNTYVFPTI